MNHRCLPVVLLLVFVGRASAQQTYSVPSAQTRHEAIVRVAANPARAFQFVAARLRGGIDTLLARRQLDTLLDVPSGDMFWSFPAAAFYFYCRDLLDSQARARFRRVLGWYAPYRGDTENHFLMHYTFLYLFSQEWPDMTAAEWFNGRSSRENHQEALEYLLHWIDETSAHGMTEWDASRYQYFYITPMLALQDFAADTQLRVRASLMLELLLTQMSTNYLDGSYVGAHSRDGDREVLDPRSADATAYAGFYFEDSLRIAGPDLAFAAMSPFAAPTIIRAISRDRNAPYVARETVRSRPAMRNARTVHNTVRRYTYMTRDFAVGSIEGGVQQPIQQHSWDVTFADRRPNNTLFGLHPDASAEELATFFPEEPELMEAGILGTKASYGSEDKWVGGSRYEAISQYRNVLVARYSLPPGVRFEHIDMAIPRSADTVARLQSGWIVVAMGRSIVGIRFLERDSLSWIDAGDFWRLRSSGPGSTYVVEAVSTDQMTIAGYLNLRGLASAILPTENGWRFEGVNGEVVIDTASASLSLHPPGAPPDWTGPGLLFDGPHLHSVEGSNVVDIWCNGERRRLDFSRGAVTP